MSKLINKKIRTNYANSFAVILLIALLANLLFYYLPEKILGVDIKKVDLLSDIRIDNHVKNLLASDKDVEDVPFFDGTTVQEGAGNVSGDGTRHIDTAGEGQEQYTKRHIDSPSPVNADDNKSDIPNSRIEDFSSGQNGLRRFFNALDNIHQLNRPVRIAFVGDSFIEGDILVADFRALMQEHFGGRGVGFLPVTSNVAQFRPTIKQHAEGWQTYTIINNKRRQHVLSGLLFEPKGDKASIGFQCVDAYPRLKDAASVKFIYTESARTEIELLRNGAKSGETHVLPPSDGAVMLYEMRGSVSEVKLKFSNAKGLQAVGLAIEDDDGIVVDNLSLRGNSGVVMAEIDSEKCREWQRIRPYDLIVLQYGLNVANDSMRSYGWYQRQMLTVIHHIQDCFPGADVLLVSVSDRSHNSGGAYTTMPAVVSLMRTQRETARDAGVVFWNLFAAMGGENSMVRFVKSGMASKDYTHLNFKGGQKLAGALYDALLEEKGALDNGE